MDTLWHGGVPDLKVGDRLLPPSATGRTFTRADLSLQAGLGSISQRTDRVYVTSDRELAMVFAREWLDGQVRRKYGWLYRVEVPGHLLEPDADLASLPGVSYQAPWADITSIYSRGVAPNDAASRRVLLRVLAAHEQSRRLR